MEKILKFIGMAIGGGFGWFVAEFHPSFPLIIIAAIFIFSDAYTAYRLDRRVHIKYPDKTSRKLAKFTSFAFSKTITVTLPKRLYLILLAFIVEHWIFIHISIPLSYIAAGAVCFEQFWSMLENEASCRDDDRESRFWRTLQKILVDKTARHFDIDRDTIRDYDRSQNMEN